MNWISVKDVRKPENEQRVLVFYEKSEHVEDATYYDEMNGYFILFDGEMLNDAPSHWCEDFTLPTKEDN